MTATTAATPTASTRLLLRTAGAPSSSHHQLRCFTRASPLLLRQRAARLALVQAHLPDRVMPFNFNTDADDHPRVECGVFDVIGDPDAASLYYLGLQKLQHRGEDGVGVATSVGDGKLKSVTGLGLVGDVFGDPARLSKLLGEGAIGHLRYSTDGAAATLRNV
jgi:amidophosphoribosyltransferase